MLRGNDIAHLCTACQAVHWYPAQQCQRCGCPTLKPKTTIVHKEEKKPDFFQIDPNQLDVEWVAQPRLYHSYAKKLAAARQDLEQAKTALEITEADLAQKIRRDPSKFGLEKLTEGAIREVIVLSADFKAATTELIDAKHLVGVLEAAVTTLEHRKRALEKLVDLRLADYFSEPRTKSMGREAREDAETAKFKQKKRE